MTVCESFVKFCSDNLGIAKTKVTAIHMDGKNKIIYIIKIKKDKKGVTDRKMASQSTSKNLGQDFI